MAGILFGIAGFAMMLYAGLLGARKKVRIWRVGRAQTWMRGHLWLGTLSLPVIVFHAGFTFGGGLTFVLMWLFVIVVASGLLGAHYLQHTMPRPLLREVPMETIYEQIEHVRTQLLEEADTVVAEACGKLEFETLTPGAWAAARQQPVAAAGPPGGAGDDGADRGGGIGARCARSTCGICGRSSRDRQRGPSARRSCALGLDVREGTRAGARDVSPCRSRISRTSARKSGN